MTELSKADVWKTPQLWWRIGIVVVCVIGLMSGGRRLAFFTGQSNLIVAAYFAVAVWWMVARRTTVAPAPRLRGGVTLWIVTTGLIAHVVLNHGASPFAGLADPDPAVALANESLLLLHYAVPLMVLADWALFGPHGTVRWRDGLVWMLYPAACGSITLLRAAALPEVSDRFPYPFFDFETLGTAGTIVALVGIVGIIAVLAAAVVGIDRMAALAARVPRARDVDKSGRPDRIADTVVA